MFNQAELDCFIQTRASKACGIVAACPLALPAAGTSPLSKYNLLATCRDPGCRGASLCPPWPWGWKGVGRQLCGDEPSEIFFRRLKPEEG